MAGNKGERGERVYIAVRPSPLPLTITPLSQNHEPHHAPLPSALLTHICHPNMVRMRVGSHDCPHGGGIAPAR